MKPTLFPTLACHGALLLMLAVLAGGGVRTQAQTVPAGISYQGVLRSGDGTLIKSTSKSMYFRVYDAPLNGTKLFEETQLVLLDTNGLFNVVLGTGSQSAVPPVSLIDVFSNPAASSQGFFLELQVNETGTSAILPRQQFLTAPFAIAANTANTAQNGGGASGTFTVTGVASINQLDVKTSATIPAITGPTRVLGNLVGDGFHFPPTTSFTNVPGLALVKYGVTPNMARMIIGDSSGWKFHISASNATQGVLDRFTFLDVGRMGINNANPTNLLDVIGTASASTLRSDNLRVGSGTGARGLVDIGGGISSGLNGSFGYLTNITTFYKTEGNGRGINLPVISVTDGSDTESVSLYASATVRGAVFQAFSDERIKHVIGRSSAGRDLETLMALEVTDYTMVDTVATGNRALKKVIAQQVERVFPQAVSRSTDVVPDIYSRAEAKHGWIPLGKAPTPALKSGDRVQLITDNGKAIREILEVNEQGFRVAEPLEGPVFVYGREVNDFRNVDYDAISMLNVSATQELHRLIQAQKAEIGALQTQVQELLARDREQAARFTALESLVRENGRGLQQASLR